MTIRELLDLAKVTTLGSYALRDDDRVLLQLLNFSLSTVYGRIPALTQIQTLNLESNRTRYEYLAKGSKVLTATAEYGKDLPINDDTDDMSIFDMGNHVLDIPVCIHSHTNRVALLLQVKPPKLECTNVETIEFTPDDALISTILSHMAYMASKNLSEENGVGHLQEFNQHIDEVVRLGLYRTYQGSGKKVFKDSGLP